MRWPNPAHPIGDTLLTLVVAAAGAALFAAVSAPVYILLGPAVAVTVWGLRGGRAAIHPLLRDACFVVLGIAVGAGFDADAVAAMQRWPLAFLFMAMIIWAIMVVSGRVLVRFFGFDARSALLAAAPGHLSFVIAMAADTGADLTRIAVSQSVRLLALTIVVPFVALAMGVRLTGGLVPAGVPLGPVALLAVAAAAVLLGRVMGRLSVPAPLLMGAMAVSAVGHLGGLLAGNVPGWLILPAYLVLGALIGTRFAGLTLAQVRSGLGAGLTITLIAIAFAAAAAVPVAFALGMPLAHVLVAFAPGGLETMIAMGVVLGVVPGFVAACHIARLLVLSVLLPVLIGRVPKDDPDPKKPDPEKERDSELKAR